MKRLITPLVLTAALVGAYAVAEEPQPTCAEIVERSYSVATAVAMGVPRYHMLESSRSPEDVHLVNRIYDESWPMHSARSMAKALCQ